MGPLAYIRTRWRNYRRRREARALQQEVRNIAKEYRTSPRIAALRNGAWALVAKGYRPVIADTPMDTVKKFRKRNTPNF